jgi:hypothetical protein
MANLISLSSAEEEKKKEKIRNNFRYFESIKKARKLFIKKLDFNRQIPRPFHQLLFFASAVGYFQS